jgi:hypothetical protein
MAIGIFRRPYTVRRSGEHGGRPGDLLYYGGQWYECKTCVHWLHTPLAHYESEFVILADQSGQPMWDVSLMILDVLKERLYECVTTYWSGATVVWGAADKVKPNAPLVVLRLGTVKRALQPITQAINGILFSAYPSDVALPVDLFTRGRRSKSGYLANTALNDLLDATDDHAFLPFCEREAVSKFEDERFKVCKYRLF